MNKWQIESACASTQEAFGLQAVAAAIRRYTGHDPAVRRQVKEGSCVRLRLDETLPANAYRLQVSEPDAQGQQVCLSGGVAQNDAVRQALSDELNVPVSVDPLAQYFGAIGAALWAYKQQV